MIGLTKSLGKELAQVEESPVNCSDAGKAVKTAIFDQMTTGPISISCCRRSR